MSADVRLPPHDVEAERGILAAMMASGSRAAEGVELLEADAFFSSKTRAVFKALSATWDGAGDPDPALIAAHLRDRHGPSASREIFLELVMILNDTYAPTSEGAFASLVEQTLTRWRLRRCIRAAQEVAAKGYSARVDEVQDLLSDHAESVSELTQSGARKTYSTLRGALVDAFQELNSAQSGQSYSATTGLAALDAATGGLQPGGLTLLAARPGQGKTALALRIATATAREGRGVVFLSLEMRRERLAVRVVAADGGVSVSRAIRGQLTPDEWNRLVRSASAVSELPIVIDDEPGVSVAVARSKARRHIQRWRAQGVEPGLVVVDYVQLLTDRDAPTDEVRVARASQGLTALAKELEVPVLALAQLSRDCERRPDRRPLLSDLRSSGQLEQDAELVLMLYRDEYYDPDTTDRGVAEVIIRKQRDGELGTVRTRFIGECVRFEDEHGGGSF